jgi:hypothetical protein
MSPHHLGGRVPARLFRRLDLRRGAARELRGVLEEEKDPLLREEARDEIEVRLVVLRAVDPLRVGGLQVPSVGDASLREHLTHDLVHVFALEDAAVPPVPQEPRARHHLHADPHVPRAVHDLRPLVVHGGHDAVALDPALPDAKLHVRPEQRALDALDLRARQLRLHLTAANPHGEGEAVELRDGLFAGSEEHPPWRPVRSFDGGQGPGEGSKGIHPRRWLSPGGAPGTRFFTARGSGRRVCGSVSIGRLSPGFLLSHLPSSGDFLPTSFLG